MTWPTLTPRLSERTSGISRRFAAQRLREFSNSHAVAARSPHGWLSERGLKLSAWIYQTCSSRARKRLANAQHMNLRFIEHDIMRIADLNETPFDAGIYLDAACYLPDKRSALEGIATQFRPGARLLLVDWCRAEHPTDLQEEMILDPFNRYWSIPGMETISGYERGFEAAGFRIIELEDLSASVVPGWERGYQAANRALAEPTTSAQLLAMAASAVKYGTRAVQFAKEQFYAAVFAKIAADAGVLRYVSFLVERL